MSEIRTILENRKPNQAQAQWLQCSESEHIKYCIRSILLTRRGERIHFPNLGGNIMSFLFQHFQSHTIQSLQAEIQLMIQTFEPRVKVSQVKVDRDERDPNFVSVSMNYQIRSTGQVDALSFQVKP